MSTPVRLLPAGGNTATLNSYVGLARELAINTDNWAVYVFDGVTAGGHIVGGMSALNQGSDVSIATPTNNQALVYNSTAGKWENQTLVSTDLSDWAAVTANYVTSASLASTLSGYLTTAAASSTYVGTASPTFTGTATFAAVTTSGNVSVGGTFGVTGATTLSSTLTVTGNATLNGTLAVAGNSNLGGGFTSSTGTLTGNLNIGGTVTGAQFAGSGHIALTGTSTNTFAGGVQVTGSTPTAATTLFTALGNTSGWGYGIKFSSAATTADASTFFLGTNTGGAQAILALFGVADSGAIGRSVLQFARSASSGLAWSSVSIGNTTDNPSTTVFGQLSVNDNSNNSQVVTVVPSWGNVAPSNLDGCQWMAFNGSSAMQSAGQTFSTGDGRMMTITRGTNNHPTIRATNLDINATTTALSGALTVAGASTVAGQLTLTSAGTNIQGPSSGTMSILTNSSANPLQINSGNQAAGQLALKINNFNPGNQIMTLDGVGNLAVSGSITSSSGDNGSLYLGGTPTFGGVFGIVSTGATLADMVVQRSGAGTANNGPGAGSNLQLLGVSGSSAVGGSALQNSGGQTEIWQYNGGWGQAMVFDTSRNCHIPGNLFTGGGSIPIYGGIPVSQSGATVNPYVLSLNDVGKMMIYNTAGGVVQISGNTGFSQGQVCWVLSNSGGATSGDFLKFQATNGMSIRTTGGSATTPNLQLNGYGLVMIWFYSSTICFICPFSVQGTMS